MVLSIYEIRSSKANHHNDRGGNESITPSRLHYQLFKAVCTDYQNLGIFFRQSKACGFQYRKLSCYPLFERGRMNDRPNVLLLSKELLLFSFEIA